jgi:hypothetical protein
MAPITKPSIPVKLEPQTDKDVVFIVKSFFEKYDKMTTIERWAISEAIRYICNPMWKVEGMSAPIEAEWLRAHTK